MKLRFVLLSLLMLWATGCVRVAENNVDQPKAQIPVVEPSASSSPAQESTPWLLLGDKTIEIRAIFEAFSGTDLEQVRGTPFDEMLTKFAVAEEVRTYHASEFQCFMPERGQAVGKPWALDGEQAAKIASQLHPSATHEMLRDGGGAYAVITGRSQDYLEIAFRLHAKFELSDTLLLFPAQFSGRILVNQSENSVEYVSLHVPGDRPRNFNYEATDKTGLVGMIYSSTMKLEGGTLAGVANLNWDESVKEAEAKKMLAQEFFASEKINWLRFEAAMEESRRSKKPIFAVVILGALSDQSC